jgi:anti-sigma regulatory factor (Ser/Thr protein kinase)
MSRDNDIGEAWQGERPAQARNRETGMKDSHTYGEGEGGTAYQNGSDLPVSLIIPGQPEYLALCRLVAGAVGAQEAADEETIADLKLIVTEACNCFLDKEASSGRASGIEVEFAPLPGALAVTVSDPQRRFHLRPTRDEEGGLTETGLALTIVRALADAVEESESEAGGSVLRLVKRLVSTPTGD